MPLLGVACYRLAILNLVTSRGAHIAMPNSVVSRSAYECLDDYNLGFLAHLLCKLQTNLQV